MYSLNVTYRDGERLIAELHRDGARVAYVSDNGSGLITRFDSAAERRMWRDTARERYENLDCSTDLYLSELAGR
jgi:hypothetical protein